MPAPPRDPEPALAERLEAIREAGLHRSMRLIEGAQGPRVVLEGREVLLLCSNNYLGLADHPAVRDAAAEAALRWGAGSGSSRLIAGNMEPHARLERALAGFHGKPSALLFGSGYLANTGTIAALAGRGEVVYSDALNHASIVDGCRLSGAAKFIYRHRDVEHLAWAIDRAAAPAALIVTDGLFSMDGDTAALTWLVELARKHGARLIVDEAHAVGAVGPGGRGLCAREELVDEVDVIVGTLGKSLGSYGAYVCTSEPLRELLVNTARPLIFSTGLPPACAAAAERALELLVAEPERIERLERNARLLREALAAELLAVPDRRTQILPVGIGEPDAAIAACARALDGGVFAQAIRPPTVPEGTSRLRLSVMATHAEQELRRAASVIGEAVRSVGGGRAGRPAVDPVDGARAGPARAEPGRAAGRVEPPGRDRLDRAA